MQRDNELVNEIKKLDGDKKVYHARLIYKTLVYENYSKFISATDTIREMRLKIDAMDAKVSKFAIRMESIGEKSVSVNESLNGNRFILI
jgi:cell division septum initiation protein DivIVA